MSKTRRSINELESNDFTPFHGQLIDPRHRVEEILRLILHKSPGFLTVGIAGQYQTDDISRIHPLDIIMFALGWFRNQSPGSLPLTLLFVLKIVGSYHGMVNILFRIFH